MMTSFTVFSIAQSELALPWRDKIKTQFLFVFFWYSVSDYKYQISWQAVIVEINWIRAEDWTTNIAILKTMVQTRYGRCKDTDTLPTNTGQNRIECSEASWQVRYWSVKGDSCFFNWKTAVLPPPPTLNYSSRPSLGFAKRHSGECRSVKVKVEYRYTNSDTIQCLIHSVRKENSSLDFGFDMFFQPVIPSSHFVFENTWGWQCIWQQSGKTLRDLSLLSPVALTKKYVRYQIPTPTHSAPVKQCANWACETIWMYRITQTEMFSPLCSWRSTTIGIQSSHE